MRISENYAGHAASYLARRIDLSQRCRFGALLMAIASVIPDYDAADDGPEVDVCKYFTSHPEGTFCGLHCGCRN